ncbi:MAG: type II toxin-antitoxin system HicA family toxin [Candidatus Kerfeldbacteria bacterium]|nr:type II toxin-antitoxin system HicA family toxin [Candidatus Kerfeldbacteria bacterium]
MPVLPSLKPREVVRAFERMGYRQYRQRGSHLIMVKDGSSHQPVIPIHARDIKKGTLRAIIRQAGLTVEEFLEFAKK